MRKNLFFLLYIKEIQRYEHIVRVFPLDFLSLFVLLFLFSCVYRILRSLANCASQREPHSSTHSTAVQNYCDREKHFRNCNLKNFGFVNVCEFDRIAQRHPLELLSENGGI